MIKNIVKIYYTEEIEIFFIEHFFKYLNSKNFVSENEQRERNVKIHNFIGILVEIFRGLRESGLTFKDLLNDFEEREKSRSRSREILKKENNGDLQSIFSGEKSFYNNEEDQYIFEVSNSKKSEFGGNDRFLSSRRDSKNSNELNLEEVYLEKNRRVLQEKTPQLNRINFNNTRNEITTPKEVFKTASSKNLNSPAVIYPPKAGFLTTLRTSLV